MGGKDRTGLVAALLLRLAGVPRGTIGARLRAHRGEPRAVGRGVDRGAPPTRPSAEAEPPPATPAEAMVRVLEEIEARYGDVASYLRAAGVDDAQLDRLRERLVAA